MRNGAGAGGIDGRWHAWVMGDGQRTVDFRFLVGLNWEDGGTYRQNGELGRKAHLKGRVIRFLVNMLSFRSLWLQA